MKESQLKKILTTPQMDASMEHRIADNLLFHDISIENSNQKVERMRAFCRYTQKSGLRVITKISFAAFVLVIIGAATALAADLFVKSYPADVSYMTAEESKKELDELVKAHELQKDKEITKYFGKSNSIALITDDNGRVILPDENGDYVREDGTKILKSEAEAYRKMDRHDRNKKNGDDAFAELGLPNLMPAYIYENYYLDDKGFIYKEEIYDNNLVKTIYAHFQAESPDIQKKSWHDIWFSFRPYEKSSKDEKLSIPDNGVYNDTAVTSYTTQTGIICTLLSYNSPAYSVTEKKHFTSPRTMANIQFDSETIGNGIMNIEFVDTDIETAKAILDTLPLLEEEITQSHEN